MPVGNNKSHLFLFLFPSENLAHHLETDSGKQLGAWGSILASLHSIQASKQSNYIYEVWSLIPGSSVLALAGYEPWASQCTSWFRFVHLKMEHTLVLTP